MNQPNSHDNMPGREKAAWRSQLFIIGGVLSLALIVGLIATIAGIWTKKGPVDELLEIERNRPSEFHANAPVVHIASIPESSALLYACQDCPTLFGIDESGVTLELGTQGSAIRSLCCAADGRCTVTGGDDGALKAWSIRDAKPTDALVGPPLKKITYDKFTTAYSIERFQDGARFTDESSGKQAIVHAGKARHRVVLGFKRNLDANPGLRKKSGRR